MRLKGDMNQILDQKNFFISRGFSFIKKDFLCYLFKTEKEFKKALKVIWYLKYNGWWNYKEDLIQYKICTDKEYKQGFTE